jgi:hypothetical protein
MYPALYAFAGFFAGGLVVTLVKLTALENAEADAYRKGYETAQADQRERNTHRARKAAATRRGTA